MKSGDALTTDGQAEDMASGRSPLLGTQQLKLGLFATNLKGGLTTSTAEGVMHPTWSNQVALAQMADRAGFDAIIPVCRWKGFGGRSDYHGASFETLTWASALAGMTDHTTVVATAHVPTIHPVLAAKQAVTIDHVSGGRFALNVVAGWNALEFDMFGASVLEHDSRYGYAEEWTEFIKRLWTVEGEFDVKGEFFNASGVTAQPKPIQPPVIISAAASDRGLEFAAKHADVVFTGERDTDGMADQVRRVRKRFEEEGSRSPQIMISVSVICRSTEKEARAHYDYCVHEMGDREAAENWLRVLMGHSKVHSPERFQQALEHIEPVIAGQMVPQLVGTPEQVADYLANLSAIGIDGVTVSFMTDWEEDMKRFVDEVIPLLEQSGVRTPYVHEGAG